MESKTNVANTAQTGLLSAGFEHALQNIDAIQIAAAPETSDSAKPDKNAVLRQAMDFYHRNKSVMDAAIEGAQAIVARPDYHQQVGTVGKLPTGDAQQEAIWDLSQNLLESPEMEQTVIESQESGLAGLGLGLGFGASFLIGFGAGADVIWNINTNNVYGRAWKAESLGLDIALELGINMGFWNEIPYPGSSKIKGFLLDLPTPIGVAVRMMLVFKGDTMLGTTVQIAEVFGAGLAVYRGEQETIAIPSKRCKLTLWNITDGQQTNTIAQNVPSVLQFRMTNTSPYNIEIAPGTAMKITMPDYFTAAEVGAMQVQAENWDAQSANANIISVTYNGADTMVINSGYAFEFTMSNVLASSAGSDSDASNVKVVIPDATAPGSVTGVDGFGGAKPLYLVPLIATGTISWKTVLNSGDYEPIEYAPTEGSDITITTQANANDIISLSAVEPTDAQSPVWILGYQFYFQSGSTEPVFRACWVQDGKTPIPGVNMYAPNFITPSSSDTSSQAYLNNVSGGNSDSLDIYSVTFDPID